MPKYELMYIVGSEISDDQIPQVVAEIKKSIEGESGIIEKQEELGKKKLAYPIKKTRNASYVVVNFSAPSEKINEIEHKVRTNQSIIRHLIVSMDEALVQMEKDRLVQAKLKLNRPDMEQEPELARVKSPAADKPRSDQAKKIHIDLDAEIEKALESEDLK